MRKTLASTLRLSPEELGQLGGQNVTRSGSRFFEVPDAGKGWDPVSVTLCSTSLV